MESALGTPSIVTTVFHNGITIEDFFQCRLVCTTWNAVSKHCAWPWMVVLARLAVGQGYSFHRCCMSMTTRPYDLVVASVVHARVYRNLDEASRDLENHHKRVRV